MDSVDPVSPSAEKVQPSQPSLTKRGMELLEKNSKPSSEAENTATPETDTPPPTSLGNSVDVTA
ncbi:MAG: hypothetical protein HOF21_15295 [Nitrospina sp.]|jgi:hypothetical protein|nr:hypothetical protein [Nitrospina sp.]MBT5631673.1 hypothetical protein [Nitrospina sp.]